MGTMYFDMEGTILAKNKTTGDTLELTFNPKGWRSERSLNGKLTDKKGNTIYTIEGSWISEIFLIDSKGKKEMIWKLPTPIEDAVRYYNFSPLTILLNHKTPEM